MSHSKTKFSVAWLKKRMEMDICLNGGVMNIKGTDL